MDVEGKLDLKFNINDQTQLISYDKKWEFPRQKLKLGNFELNCISMKQYEASINDCYMYCTLMKIGSQRQIQQTN